MIHKVHDINEHTKSLIDWTSIGIAFGSFMQILPSIAAALSIVWTLIRIYETKTVQKWLGKGKTNAE